MSEPEKKSRIDRLFDRVETHGFESLTLSERSAFALRCFYLETNNGGLHQFFFNDSGKLSVDALRGLNFLGATETAEILRQALTVFPDGKVPLNQTDRREFLCDVLTPDQEDFLDKLTKQFFQSSEPVADLLAAYIEKHPEEFPT